MTDFAENTTAMRRLLKDAEQCERDKMYQALIFELEDMEKHIEQMLAYARAKYAEDMQQRIAA
jgi:transcriptional regulator with AAA-type ATPase domain